jgi:hypothetical protein
MGTKVVGDEDPFRGRTEFTPMSVACILVLNHAADSPAPVPPSDADLLDIQGPLRRTDPTNFRLRKQKSLEVYQHLSLDRSIRLTRTRFRPWGPDARLPQQVKFL